MQVCFEYFFRSLPPHTGFAVSAGLESFLDYIEHLRFTPEDIDYLRSLEIFEESFFAFLADYQFRGTVHAVPEGTVVFPHEPLIRIEGNLFDCQIVETALLNLMNYATLIATKTARICQAAEGEPGLELGLRRARGPDGGLSGSRAAYIGGCTASSNVLAGKVYGVPVAGTHAHSWVMSFSTEYEAFRTFARLYPNRCTLLVDTYDTIESGVPNAIRVFKEMHEQGQPVRPAIRLDSGDLARLSKAAYRMMRDAGFDDPLIVASNDLNEDLIADLKRQGAKINAWGVGTQLITAYDSPALSGVYKLTDVHVDGVWRPRIKISSNLAKATNPARKRVVRYFDGEGHPVGDVQYHEEELRPTKGTIPARQHDQPHHDVFLRDTAASEDLFQCVVDEGERTAEPVPIEAIRQRAQEQIASLPEEYKRLRNPEIYRVLLSRRIGDLKERLLEDPNSV